MGKVYKLLDGDGHIYFSETKGTFGGHRGLKIYGRLDCPSALRFIAKGQYVKHRVFFATALDAAAAGYRPCAKCMKERYEWWKLYRSEWNAMVADIRDELAKERKKKAKETIDAVKRRAAGSR